LKPHESITSLRFDLHLAESSISHLRLDLDINPVTKKPLAWKLTGPRHRAAELNTFVIETYVPPKVIMVLVVVVVVVVVTELMMVGVLLGRSI
jgi:hypothetical protein